MESPINSRLNYAYAVLRNALIRSILLAGFIPSVGLHHDNQYNSFNLADDLIEPWRPAADLVAFGMEDKSVTLDGEERRKLSMVMHHACRVGGKKTTVLTGIEIMTGSLKNSVLENDPSRLLCPELLPKEAAGGVTE